MRDPFIAIDVATDLRAHARLLRGSWEAALIDARAASPLAALMLFVKRAPAADQRRAVAAARARSLRVRWGLAGEPATA